MKQNIDSIARELRQKRVDLLEEVAENEEDLDAIQELREIEMEEQARDESTAKFLSRMSERKIALVEEIDVALTRIEKGDYGFCEECGEKIAWERMQALPLARMCIDCAEEVEKKQRMGTRDRVSEEIGRPFGTDLTPLTDES